MKKTIIAAALAALTLAATVTVPAFAFADGSVHFNQRSIVMSDLNPQPLPPGRHGMISGYSAR
jgi:hypothetical protein